jgi:16S rRNA (cytosine1402-N4)-methyltransferase
MHESVLLAQVLEWLRPAPHIGFRALDATLGDGGHSFGLLERSAPDGQVVALDADAAAIDRARARLQQYDARVTLIQANFREIGERELGQFDAVLFDLGLSSPQLDESGRGFSFRFDEPLDMRFDTSTGATAADLLNTESEAELERILREYGEERDARRIARAIVRRRASEPLQRTGDVIALVGPQRGRIHPATRTFQALRIAVNDELGALEAGLDSSVELLKPSGRMAVISFHSLEDRIVKWRFRAWASRGMVSILTKKPVQPGEDDPNPRARSAKLRVAERAA